MNNTLINTELFYIYHVNKDHIYSTIATFYDSPQRIFSYSMNKSVFILIPMGFM